jgi:hypothetical protein
VNLLPTASESNIVKHVSTEKGNAGEIRVEIEVRYEIDDLHVVVMPSV